MNYFKNYAGRDDVDDLVAAELEEAKIEVVRFPESWRSNHPEMRTVVLGQIRGWLFRRAWRYWVAEGNGVAVDYAETLHSKSGNVVRVEGHCGCPSPYEYRAGLPITTYHIDAQEGLNAFVETVNEILADGKKKYGEKYPGL